MIRNRARGAALLRSVAALLVSACSEHVPASTGPGNDGDVVEVVISDFAFTTPTLTINSGESVRWRSATGTFHTVTPDGHQAFAGRQLNGSGLTYQVRFDAPGRYRYYCEPHRALGMSGEVIVR